MQHPEHLISGPRKGLTPERMAGLVFGGIIPAVFIWALMAGLIPKFTIPTIPPIDTRIIPQKPEPKGPAPTTPTFHGPTFHMPTPPDWTPTNTDAGRGIEGQYGNGPAFNPPNDTQAHGVMATHTIPPYPPLSIRLEEQGTVMLRLEISADGSVTNASVEKSSGSSRLDQAAIAWVIQNWRYQPATHDGVAVPTTTEAAVKFDLRNAMR